MNPYHTSHTKVNSKSIRLECETWNQKTPKVNIGGKLLDISLCDDYLDLTTKTKAAKAKNKQ